MTKLIWAVALISAFGSAALAAARVAVPSAEFWARHPNIVVAALVITFGVPLSQAGLVEGGERRRRKRIEREQKIQAALVASLIYAANHGGADWQTTGIQAFAVRGWWRWQKQDRVAKLRLAAIASSGVKWSKGKGVIGRCWASRLPQYEDLAAHFAPYDAYARHQWDALTDDVRFGLTYDDFCRLRGKYGIVAAVPIVSRDKYIGCMTADMPPLPAGATPPAREEILNTLTVQANVVGYLLND